MKQTIGNEIGPTWLTAIVPFWHIVLIHLLWIPFFLIVFVYVLFILFWNIFLIYTVLFIWFWYIVLLSA